MPFDKRTNRERVFIAILKKRASLTNTEIRKAASEFPIFKGVDEDTLDKYVDRFIQHGEYLGIITRRGRLIQLLDADQWDERPRPQVGQFVLKSDGLITSRAGLRCRHCMTMIDLTQVKIWRRFNSDTLLRILDVHHFFWVTCPKCKVKARYDMNEDVKPIFPNDSPE